MERCSNYSPGTEILFEEGDAEALCWEESQMWGTWRGAGRFRNILGNIMPHETAFSTMDGLKELQKLFLKYCEFSGGFAAFREGVL